MNYFTVGNVGKNIRLNLVDISINNILIPKGSIGIVDDFDFTVKWRIDDKIVTTPMTHDQLSALLTGNLIEFVDSKDISKNKPLYKVGDMVKTICYVGFIDKVKYDSSIAEYYYYIKQLPCYFGEWDLEKEYEKNISLVDVIEDEIYIEGEDYIVNVKRVNNKGGK